ncbi:hypothetical protein [Photobacterium sp.]|uniref:hypothetical protein n=1 Tax=Photobacterium sp. TaxID=660 RepID=UPI00299D3B7E|nr:hypothetical protein [Photobacterium sp.]MDX1300888.1 hypothetical protein [Photobacterium sp.]
MKVKMDPLTVVIVSILLGWGWTEVTRKPICQQEIMKDGVKYTMPVSCSVLTNEGNS